MRYPKQASLLKYLLPEYLFLADPLHNAIKHGEDVTQFLPYMQSPRPAGDKNVKKKRYATD